jgi:hypothetical protein
MDSLMIEYLPTTNGATKKEFERKSLWPITFEGFSIIYTSTLVVVLRNVPGGQGQANNTRPGNEGALGIQIVAICASGPRTIGQSLLATCHGWSAAVHGAKPI